MMAETATRTRCNSCGKGMPYEAWSRGAVRCDTCARAPKMDGPAATYVRGPVASRTPATPALTHDSASYERLLDEMPDELVDELVAALEAEVARMEVEKSAPASAVQEVLRDIGFNRSPREWQWAAWGFAIGFGANVMLAKYAQMASGGSMGEFAGPLLLGGMVAGITSGTIGWGLAKLRER